jgi:hypothetical protein
MNILHEKIIGDFEGFRILFEAVQPMEYPEHMTEGEADAVVSNALVCFTPHLSAMKNGYVVGMIQCPVEIMTDYDIFYNDPNFKELIQQAVIEAQITIGDHVV